MRRYELMVIVTDQLEQDGAAGVVDRIKEVVAQQGGTVVGESFWGKRELAYEIDHRHFGWYVVFDLEMSDEGQTELERQLKISDNVVRFKTVRVDLRTHRVKSA